MKFVDSLPKSIGNTASYYIWEEEAEKLRQNPGKWALIKEGDRYRAMASNISRGLLKAFTPPGHFEGSARKRPDGLIDIYARYVGDKI